MGNTGSAISELGAGSGHGNTEQFSLINVSVLNGNFDGDDIYQSNHA
jgi:hypothetical protein